MIFNFSKKSNDPYIAAFRQIAISHNVRSSRLLTAIIGIVGLMLVLIAQYSNADNVLRYPREYEAAIKFVFASSCFCFLAFLACRKMNDSMRHKAYKFFSDFYAIIIVISSLWITFVMQHNPSNTMSIFVLGILTVAALWIFDKMQTLIIAVFILLLFDGGLHYFQTDSCKLFTNYITGTCVSIFFVCISRICFSVNYRHFLQLKKIEENNKDLARLNEIQTNIVSIVAHDLRTPNSNIIGLVTLLKDESVAPEEKSEFYDMILTTCTSANEIIEDLLSLARNELQEANFTPTDMNAYMEMVVVNFKRINNCSQQINFEATQVKQTCRINAQKIQRVVENLLGNAVKFSGSGGLITVKLKKETDKLAIYITDNGIGIPAGMMPHLFRRFSQAGRKGLKGEKTNGLGLSICKLFVEQHHGSISIDSEEGKGTEAKITLPLA